MFTGIIQKTARIKNSEKRGAVAAVRIEKPAGWRFKKGESVSVDGICSTVVRSGARTFDVEYMPETRERTTAGDFVAGRIVNLERPLKLSDHVDGHFVLGHVDDRTDVRSVTRTGKTARLTVAAPPALRPYLVEKGSVTINGAALTVASRSGAVFDVALIPYTLEHTNLGALRAGDTVNVEADMFARYAVAAVRGGGTVSRNAKKRI